MIGFRHGLSSKVTYRSSAGEVNAISLARPSFKGCYWSGGLPVFFRVLLAIFWLPSIYPDFMSWRLGSKVLENGMEVGDNTLTDRLGIMPDRGHLRSPGLNPRRATHQASISFSTVPSCGWIHLLEPLSHHSPGHTTPKRNRLVATP